LFPINISGGVSHNGLKDSDLTAQFNNDYEYNDYQDVREMGFKEKEDTSSVKKEKFEHFHDQEADMDKRILRKAPRSEDSGFVSTLKIVPMVVKNSKYDESSQIMIPTVNTMRQRLKEPEKLAVQTQPASGGKENKKIYQKNLRERIKNLYKKEEEKEIIKEDMDKSPLKKKVISERKRFRPRVQEDASEFKKDEINIVDDADDSKRLKLKTHRFMNPRKRFNKIKKDILSKRISETKKTEFNDNIVDDYDVGNDNFVVDQKAVETSKESSKIKSQSGTYFMRKTNAKGDDEITNTDQAVTSFNQMRFWRNRFESDRIKTFLDSKKGNLEKSKIAMSQSVNEKFDNSQRSLQRKKMPFLKTSDGEKEDDNNDKDDIPFLKDEPNNKPIIKVNFCFLILNSCLLIIFTS
jgi:hypothetical protein